MEVRIQSVVVEFILNHTDVLFSAKLSSLIREGAGVCVLVCVCVCRGSSCPLLGVVLVVYRRHSFRSCLDLLKGSTFLWS